MRKNIREFLFPRRVTGIFSREILDSRGNPTLEVEMSSGKLHALEQVPSGASTGKYEAKELRDGGKRYHGKGVLKAVHNVSVLAQSIMHFPLSRQREFDQTLCAIDPSKSQMGANAMLGLSLAYARLSSQAREKSLAEWIAEENGTQNMTLPVPYMNIINGGKHAGDVLSFQEHMIVPYCKTYSLSLQAAVEVYGELKILLAKKYGSSAINVGDEGGFAPSFKSVTEPFELMQQAVDNAGYTKHMKFAIDAAATSFYQKKKKNYFVCGKAYSQENLLGLYEMLAKQYPLVSIEDPFEENSFDMYATLLKNVGRKVQIVGDDLTVSQVPRVKSALDKNAISALLLKVNQVGTFSEALDSARVAQEGGCHVMVSHRSGETESTFVADLAVGLGCGQIKTGAPCRGERTNKYNQLLRLEELFCGKIKYAGRFVK